MSIEAQQSTEGQLTINKTSIDHELNFFFIFLNNMEKLNQQSLKIKYFFKVQFKISKVVFQIAVENCKKVGDVKKFRSLNGNFPHHETL